MSSSKSKNLIIIMLVLLNLMLLGILIFDSIQDREARREQEQAVTRVLVMRGIEPGEDVRFDIEAPVPCTIIRDSQSEETFVSEIIGECSKSDLGGNIIYYESDEGQAVFRGNGEMDVVFSGLGPNIGNGGRDAAKYLGRCGLSLYEESAEYSEGDLIISCALDGYCVYNANLVFTLSGDSLMMINGTRIFNGLRTDSDEKVIDCVTAVMRFLEIVKEEGYICSSLTSLEAGYFLSVSVSGESVLSPVWHIETDTGDLYINAITGKIETLTT